jgi:hypothetical protein
MQKITTIKILTISSIIAIAVVFGIWDSQKSLVEASSHREAPLIANDPLADNTDLYAFRSPDDTNTVTIIANYVPLQLPQGGPNYASFGENIRYEMHIKNDASTIGDDITYRFTFTKTNQDPTTFFNIRLGQQNLKTTYTAEKSVGGGPFLTIVSNGIVPPPNIGPRSISDPTVGLGAANYNALITSAIATGGGGETIYCGPADDPFFVDLGGIFDLGQTRAGGTGMDEPTDGVACKNIHTIAIKVPISTLQKNGQAVTSAANILDSDFIIGVWASASRQQIRTLSGNGTQSYSGDWVQVSRIGMPLTNEAVIPIGNKDKWNSLSPYAEDPAMEAYFCNPELGLYMDNSLFGGAVPGLAALRIQRNSLQSFDFGNTNDGLWPIRATNGGAGTALDTLLFGNYLLRQGQPRSVDLLPIFYTGVPNLAPYQLATGKNGNPLAVGKPFINNFLPTFGDMLRLNMAVPVTPRNSPAFSSLGLVQAAVLGLTDPAYNSNTNIQWIPNMDGFPNGRRLEDDVTRIELQAVGGVVLAAIGLWYDDYTSGGPNPVTPNLVNVLSYTTGVETNDTTFKSAFPYVQTPWEGYGRCGSSLNVTFSNIVNTVCNTGGSVKAIASGGTSFYTYSWSNGASTATISNLAAGTYTVTVSSSNDSATASITIVNTAIAVPTGLTTTAITGTSATLSWNAVPGAATYTIRGRKVGTTLWKTVGPVTGTSKNVQSQMSCGKTYEWKVRANCGNGNGNGNASSAYSSTATFTTTACPNASSKTNSEWDGDFKTFDLSPNPANNLVTLSYTTETETSLNINIINITGRVVLQQNILAIQGDNTINLATTQLPKGYYVVELNDGTAKMHEKLLIVR